MDRVIKSFHVIRELIHQRPDVSEEAKEELARISDEMFTKLREAHGDVVIDAGEVRLIYTLKEAWNFKKIKNNSLVDPYLKEAPNTAKFYFISWNDAPDLYSNYNMVLKLVRETLHKEIVFYNINMLQYNVTKHTMVPKHERIFLEEEKEAIRTQHEIRSLNLLPLIPVGDPVVRAIGGQIDDIVKVTRYSADAGEHIVYRYCTWPQHN